MRYFAALTFLFICSTVICAQEKGNPRVYIFESKSWVVSGGIGDGSGGARPQTAEIIKTFGERCPSCVVTMHKDKADYLVLLEHEGGKDFFRRDNKFVLFNRDGEAIESGSTRILGNAVKDACKALLKDWKSRGGIITEEMRPNGEQRARIVHNNE